MREIYKVYRRKHGESICNFELHKDFIDSTHTHTTLKKKKYS